MIFLIVAGVACVYIFDEPVCAMIFFSFEIQKYSRQYKRIEPSGLKSTEYKLRHAQRFE